MERSQEGNLINYVFFFSLVILLQPPEIYLATT